MPWSYADSMGASYHQFCPVAKAMELLDERWTMLIIRELGCGSERFNDLRRGVPQMSPTLLSKRLQQLTRAGIVERRADESGVRYVLTQAGRELWPIVQAVGAWGVRWIGELGDRDLDPKLLLWDMHRNINHVAVPDGKAVVEFRFPDVAPRASRWWLVITPDDADVCDSDPGQPVTATVTTDLRTMTGIWRGDLSWTDALRGNTLAIDAPSSVRRAMPTWFALSGFAGVERPG